MYLKDLKLISLISVSLLFLALNSIFCKIALVNNYIDAYSFTFFRLFSASLVLVGIFYFKNQSFNISLKSNWLSSFMLFLYAICFSYSYLSLDAGFGTLLLFGVVQVFLFLASIFYKEKISLKKIFGIVIAFVGLVILLYPSEEFEVSYFHSFLMVVSGLAWALYSLFGKNSNDALTNNMDSFIKATFFISISYFIFLNTNIFLSFEGLALSFISGGLTSGLGYVLWYKVVSQIEVLTSSVIQLLVPLLSIIISVAFLDELLTYNLITSTILIFLGVMIVVYKK